MKKNTYLITVFHNKSAAARKLGISRKTIQRKVSKGELAENSYGGVCIDELKALLEVDAMSGRRGPKIIIKEPEPSNKQVEYVGRKFVKAVLDVDEVTRLNETIDMESVEEMSRSFESMKSATLETLAKYAMCICNHKRRLARLGSVKDASEIREALRPS